MLSIIIFWYYNDYDKDKFLFQHEINDYIENFSLKSQKFGIQGIQFKNNSGHYSNESTLVIPGVIEHDKEYEISRISSYSFYKKEFYSLILPSTIKYLENCSFGYLSLHTLLDLSKTSIEYISTYCFYGSNIPEIKFPENIKIHEWAFVNISIINLDFIYPSAFENCLFLESFIVQNWNLREIPDSCFKNCPALKLITISKETYKLKTLIVSNYLKTIGNRSFYNASIEHLDLSKCSMLYITTEAFSNSKLKSIIFPDGEVSIYEGAFSKTEISNVYIANLKHIQNSAFEECINLTSVYIKNSTAEDLPHRLFFGCGKLTTISFPSSIIRIGNHSFSWTNISSFPNLSLHSIGSYAFLGSPLEEFNFEILEVSNIKEYSFAMTNLKSIELNKRVVLIERNAFAGSVLFKINISLTNIKNLESHQFDFVHNLQIIILPKKLEVISGFSFKETKIEELVIPRSLSLLKDYAFSGAKNLKYIDLSLLMIFTIPNYCFENCYSLEQVTFPYVLENIESYAFCHCYNLTLFDLSNTVVSHEPSSIDLSYIKKLILPSSICNLSNSSFAKMPNVEEIDLSHTKFTELPENLFYKCHNLRIIHLPYNVQTISNSYFEYSKFSQITMPKHLVTVDYYAFSNSKVEKLDFSKTDCKKFGAKAFFNCSIREIVMPKSLIEIGSCCFEASGITEIKIPSRFELIGYGAFYNTNLIKFECESRKLTEIESYLFCECPKLISINLCTNALKSIGQHAFSNTRIHSLILTDTTEILSEYSFAHSNIGKLSLYKSSITSIPYRCFYNTSILDFDLPSNVKSIGDEAFFMFPNSTEIGKDSFSNASIEIFESDKVSKLEEGAFMGCYELKEVNLEKSTLLEIPKNCLKDCPKLEIVILPSCLTRIGDFSFCNTLIHNITIPKTCIYLGVSCFENLLSLESVNFSYSNIHIINDFCFKNCKQLLFLTCLFEVDELGIETFSNTGIKNIELENLSSIGFGCFRASKLSTFCINKSTLKHIPNECFSSCEFLSHIKLPSTIESIGEYSFSNTKLFEVELLENTNEIGQFSFSNCKELKKVDLSKTKIKVIHKNCFEFCSNLNSIDFPFHIIEIKEFAFKNTAISEIILPETLKNLGNDVFSYCNRLILVDIKSESLTKIPCRAFESCIRLNIVNLPKYIVEIGDYAFNNCPLTLSQLPTHISTIGSYALANTKLKELFLENTSLIVIKERAFYCSSIELITLPDTLCEVANNAFEGDKVTIIYYGNKTFDGNFTGVSKVFLPKSNNMKINFGNVVSRKEKSNMYEIFVILAFLLVLFVVFYIAKLCKSQNKPKVDDTEILIAKDAD